MEMNMTKIFIIDDEQSVVRMLTEYLSRLNYDCEGFFFDKDLLEAVREFMPDIIICDMNLQSTNGLEILTLLKQNIDLADISFVFLTGSINEVAIKKGFELGADECLRKPLDLSEIENQISHVLNRKRFRNSNHLKVLAINQNNDRLDNLEVVVNKKSNTVLKAHNLTEAKEILSNNSVDIIISSTNFIDGNFLDFYENLRNQIHDIYVALIIDANELSLNNKARKLGINDFIYSNYGENYFRGKIYQILSTNNAYRFKFVFSLKKENPENILKSCQEKAFTGDILIISQQGKGMISMCNGKYTDIKFNDKKKSIALEVISSLKDGEMIVDQKKFDIN
jgi:PleD family two-component response regulator